MVILLWAVLLSVDMLVVAFIEAIVFLSVHECDFSFLDGGCCAVMSCEICA